MNSLFRPTVPGYYWIYTNVQYAGPGYSGIFVTSLYKNGSKNVELNVIDASLLYLRCVGAALVAMNGTTDYLEIYARHSQGGSQPIGGTEFSGFLIRPL